MLVESVRTVARRRRQVPGWLLFLMWPVVRYSDERGAWVMRLVGERMGPVLVGPVPPVSAVPVDDGLPRLTLRRVSWMLGLALIAAAAATAGFFVLHRGSGASHGQEQTMSAAGLRIAVPGTWRRDSPASVAGLGLSDVISVAPSGSRREMLVVGHATTPDPQLLPRPLLASLATSPTPQAVTLGTMRFYRYSDLVPRGRRTVESVYALPTTAGTVVGICALPAPGNSFVTDCEHTLATLTLLSGRALPLGPDPHYASVLNQVVSQLNASRRRESAALLAARTPSAQAAAADALAAAHSHAATALAATGAGPAAGASAAVVSALKEIASAYTALGSAASHHDSSAYRSASASVQKASAALTAAYSGLSAYGYSAG